jgi:hypothetical protein
VRSTSISATPKYDATQGIVGGFLFGAYGLLAGFLGGNKPENVCMNCGHVFPPPRQAASDSGDGFTFGCLIVVAIISLSSSLS